MILAILLGGAIFLGLYLAFGQPVVVALGAVLLALTSYGAWADWRRTHRGGVGE